MKHSTPASIVTAVVRLLREDKMRGCSLLTCHHKFLQCCAHKLIILQEEFQRRDLAFLKPSFYFILPSDTQFFTQNKLLSRHYMNLKLLTGKAHTNYEISLIFPSKVFCFSKATVNLIFRMANQLLSFCPQITL